ncbi:MAG: SLC13 family permease [Desulfitobacteriaceae bacterium]|nr:SLC13 family permease [Desulfitobacteriaceae bacterium]MDD4751744.1 SLC13 family permease [Desulfitobacteriaceae bacterium]
MEKQQDHTLKTADFLTLPYIGTCLLWTAALIIEIAHPFDGLSNMGHNVFATIICVLAIWIFKPGKVPYVTGTVILIVGCVLSGINLSNVAAGFADSSVWLLIPALFFGFALKKTGLGNRIAYFMLKSIKPSYKGILVCWFILGIVFSLLTPSIGIRFLILTAISVSVADACSLLENSKGRSLIIITAWAAGILPGIGWYTGSLYGPVVTGFLSESMKSVATEQMWSKVMVAPWMFISIGFFIGCYFLFRPKEELQISKNTFKKLYSNLGPTTKAEKIVLFTLIIVFVCMPFQLRIGVSSYQLMLLGFLVLLLTKVIEKKDINVGVSWDIILFIGAIISLSNLINISGIADWIAPTLESIMPKLAGSSLLFLLGVTLLFFLLRFIDVTWGWAVAAFLATAAPLLYNTYHIHPTIIMFIFTLGGGVFFFNYQQPWIPQAESIMQNSGWNPRHLLQASFLYAGLAFLTLIIFLPYWKMIGVMP